MAKNSDAPLESKQRIPALFTELWNGKTLPRIYMEHKLGHVKGHGLVLDLGGGGSRNYEKILLDPTARVLTTDIRPDSGPSFTSDAEAGLPLRGACFDLVLLLNVLEHIYHYQVLISEAGRVLKPGGVLYLYIPFLYPRHTARYEHFYVDDYFRYGPETMKRLLIEEGKITGRIEIEVCGYGPFTACANIIATATSWRWLRLAAHWLGLKADQLLVTRKSKSDSISSIEWPIAYWIKAVK